MALFRKATRIVVGILPLLAACGCTVLSTEEDKALREARSQDVDAGRYVAARWDSRVRPSLVKRATAPADLASLLAEGLDKAGSRIGRKAGEGSPWTFVVHGEATVEAIDNSSRRGTVTIAFATPAGKQRAIVQAGPYVSGTSVRDALDFVRFNDFKDQIAFAEIGNALTARALRESQALATAKIGSRIEVMGVIALQAQGDAWIITPVAAKAVS